MANNVKSNKQQRTNNRFDNITSFDPKQGQARERNTNQEIKTDFIPAYDVIQLRAYQIHQEKGGSDMDNWLEAERILKSES